MLTAHSTQLRAMIATARFDRETVHACQRFRKRLFVDRLAWQLQVRGDREVDQFDHADAEHVALFYQGDVVASFRATPTTAPYLSAEVFPELASMRPYPCRPDAIEISRFGAMTGDDSFLNEHLAIANYALMFELARRRRATSLVAIADLAYERFLRRRGIACRRYGPAARHELGDGSLIGLVAGEIPVGDPTFSLPPEFADALNLMEIQDHADEIVRGREAVSA